MYRVAAERLRQMECAGWGLVMMMLLEFEEGFLFVCFVRWFVEMGSGVVIENASIREDALDYLDLPFKVQYGCIGQLRLQVRFSCMPLIIFVL